MVAELKRDEDRDVHLQAINYAALVSRFDLETLADAHAKFLTQRGAPTSVEAARDRLLEHAEEFEPDGLRTPRIVLVAAGFPRIVTHTAVWLSEMGLDISLVQVQLWRSGDELITSFERLYPVPAMEEFTLAPARQEVAAAKARAEEKTGARAASTGWSPPARCRSARSCNSCRTDGSPRRSGRRCSTGSRRTRGAAPRPSTAAPAAG